VAGGFLDVSEWDTGVEGGGDECVPQGVRSDAFGDTCTACDAVHDPGGGVAVEAFTSPGEEDRAFVAFADGEVDGAGGARGERDDDNFAALAGDGQGAVAAFEAEVFDVRAERFGYPQAVQCQQ
jgi:hypothetical protein